MTLVLKAYHKTLKVLMSFLLMVWNIIYFHIIKQQSLKLEQEMQLFYGHIDNQREQNKCIQMSTCVSSIMQKHLMQCYTDLFVLLEKCFIFIL